MKGNPFIGAGYLLRGFSLIVQPGIRQFVLIPFCINTLLFSILIGWGAGQFDQFITTLLPAWLDWLRWLLWPLFALAVSLTAFFTFIVIGNLMGAPFNGLLSEAVEKKLKGYVSAEEFKLSPFFSQCWPAVVSEFKKIGYFLVRGGPLLILFLIPGLNIVAPFLWLIFSAWMLGLEYLDYPMGNHGILFSEQRKLLQQKRLMVFGFGGAGLFLLMIPIVNFLVMPVAVTGATAMWIEQFEQAPGISKV